MGWVVDKSAGTLRGGNEASNARMDLNKACS